MCIGDIRSVRLCNSFQSKNCPTSKEKILMKGNRFLCSTLCLFSCAVSPTLRAQNSGFVYLANFGNAQQPGSILGYAISDNIGALTAVPGPPFQIQLGGGLLTLD